MLPVRGVILRSGFERSWFLAVVTFPHSGLKPYLVDSPMQVAGCQVGVDLECGFVAEAEDPLLVC